MNVSRGGLAVRTACLLEVGTALKVRFRLRGGKREIEADARVAWVDRRMGMGLQFTRVDDLAQSDIDEFIESHFFSNRKA